MASNTSDSSSSGSSNGEDVYRNPVEQAVRSTIDTAAFYGSPSKNLRDRKQQEKVPPPPQSSQSSSGLSVIDDTDDDKTYHPSGGEAEEETPRVGSRRGSLPGLLGARKTLFKRTYKNAAAGKSGSPDMFGTSSNDSDVRPSTSRGAGIARGGRGSRRPRAAGRSRIMFGTSSTDSESGTVQPDVRPGSSRGAGRARGPRGGRGSRGGRAAGRPRGSRGGRGGVRPHMMSPDTSPDDPAPLQHAASQTDDISVPSTSRPQPPTKINKGPGRKHVSDPDAWKKNMAKRGRAEGRSYTSSTSGREYEAAKSRTSMQVS
ncbi:unnamed protein product [Meganyctiphanes norvegica]|uniref:Uncharacterized protein n=1 Tax=Meganyctiphanes norvegica TaxID=48144 RepID=A0AAV2S202_MEGNR